MPQIVPFSFGDEPFTSGDSAHTVCAAAEGDLPMDINWVFHGQKYSSMMGITTTKVGARSNMLQIESVAAAHSGNYTCTARNNAGTRNYTAVLVVFGTNTRRPKQLPFWNIFLCPESLPRSLRRCFYFLNRVYVFFSQWRPLLGLSVSVTPSTRWACRRKSTASSSKEIYLLKLVGHFMVYPRRCRALRPWKSAHVRASWISIRSLLITRATTRVSLAILQLFAILQPLSAFTVVDNPLSTPLHDP